MGDRFLGHFHEFDFLDGHHFIALSEEKAAKRNYLVDCRRGLGGSFILFYGALILSYPLDSLLSSNPFGI